MRQEKDPFLSWGVRRIGGPSRLVSLHFFILGIIFVANNTVVAQNEGDRYIQDSLRMLLSARTIEGDIRIETYAEGKKYTAHGSYAEQALPQITPGTFLRSMYRLEINFINLPMAHNSKPNRMTLVCHPSEDSKRNLITRYICIEGNESFSSINLAKVEEQLKAVRPGTVAFANVSEVRYWGGLAGMMRQISRFYEFATATQENLQDEETVPTWKLTGTLKSIYSKELLTQFGGTNKKGHYPADFPSDIEVWLGRHNDFPYKIRYLRRVSENSSRKEPLFQESFFKVNVNGPPIPASKFAPLTPPENVSNVQDVTENYLRELGLVP